MFKRLLCLFMVSFGSSAIAASQQPVLAIITYDSGTLGADGVTRTSHYQESFIRTQDQVWSQRIVPLNTPAQSHHEAEQGHNHPDLSQAARHITPTEKGLAAMELVSARDKIRIKLSDIDYEDMSFDTCWPCARSLINPTRLKNMKQISRTQGTVRYEQKSPTLITIIDWDEALALPSAILVKRVDGTRWSSTQVALKPWSVNDKPWLKLQAYTEARMSDFMD